MTAIREPGKINDNTTLIDCGLFGVAGVGAVYLVEAGKTCLIDSGTKEEAPRIIQALQGMDAFPPDYVVLTHSHHDHSQGVPVLRKKTAQNIEVMAAEKAIPLLEDQSWNKAFYPKKKFQDIHDVVPLKERETIDLDGLMLKVIDVPGHIKDHIALIDDKNRNIFIGDSIGYKVGDQAVLSPIMPPFWSKEEFGSSLEKLSRLDFEGLSLAHFGYIYGEEAQTLPEEMRQTVDLTWQLFETAEENDKLDDVKYLTELFVQEFKPVFPDFKVEKFMMRFLLGMMNSVRKIARKPPILPANLLLSEVLGWSVKGYKISKGLD